MLSQYKKETKYRLLIGLVALFAFFTWMKLLRNNSIVRWDTEIKIERPELSESESYFQVNGTPENVQKTTDKKDLFSKAQGYSTLHTSEVTTKSNRSQNEQNEKSCKLDMNLPYINTTHYEINPPVFPNISSKTFNVQSIFPLPEIQLDPDKFLYPAGRWGPNNQLMGFFEALFVAVVLNRTFVLPRFGKHYRDKQKYLTDYTSPSHYVDVKYYCKFLSCITLEAFQKTCGLQIDKIMNTKYLQSGDFDEIQRNLGMRYPPGSKNISDILLPLNGTSKSKKLLSFTSEELKVFFNTSARCMIYPYPIQDLQTFNSRGRRVALHSAKPRKVYHEGQKEPPDSEQLFHLILQHYKRPLFIRQIVEDFLQNVTKGNPFLSVHWRYNERDFLADVHCNNKKINNKICIRAKKFSVQDLAKRICEKVESIQKQGFKLKNVYFATPSATTMKDYEKLSKLISGKGLKLYTSKELIQFITSTYKECEFLPVHFDEVISTAEMEICSRGLAFMGSQATSWSANVKKSRIHGNITGIKPEWDDNVFTETL